VERPGLSYQILKGEEHGLLIEKDLIETAIWLGSQGLVRCIQAGEGVAVQLSFEGIDAWMRARLDELQVDWRLIQPGVYGIAVSNEIPRHIIENGQSVFQFSYRSLWLEPFVANIPCLPQDTTISFADIFCERLNLRQLVERISHNQNAAFVLKWEKDGLYLNQIQIVTDRSNIRKTIMQILIEYQKNKPSEYISFEGIAEILQDQKNFIVNDLHSQVYRHLHTLQTRVAEKMPQIGYFIEIRHNRCRLNPSIWATD
jgi:hypothetical protein